MQSWEWRRLSSCPPGDETLRPGAIITETGRGGMTLPRSVSLTDCDCDCEDEAQDRAPEEEGAVICRENGYGGRDWDCVGSVEPGEA